MQVLINQMLLLVDAMKRTEDRPMAIQEFGILMEFGFHPLQVAVAGAFLESAGLVEATEVGCDCGAENCNKRFVSLAPEGERIVAELKAKIQEKAGVNLDNLDEVKTAAVKSLRERKALGHILSPTEEALLADDEEDSVDQMKSLIRRAAQGPGRSSYNIGGNPDLN